MLLLKWTLCAALLAEFAICPKLWTSVRGFPTIPVAGQLPDLPQAMCLILMALMVAAILVVAMRPRPGFAAFMVPALGFTLASFDLTRMQPWFYQYLLLFAALGISHRASPDSNRSQGSKSLFAFIIASTYFWSGLQKLNLRFATTVFPWFLHPFGWERLDRFWLCAPIMETSIGIGLLIPRTRPPALAGAVALHLFLILTLGPALENYNAVIWPWNLSLLLMVLLVFYGNRDPLLVPAWKHTLGKPLMILVALMPALNLVGLWDSYLSDALYSGNTRDAYLLLNEEGVNRLPAHLRRRVEHAKGRFGLDVGRWAMADLGVPPYPEVRAYRTLARRIVQQGIPPEDIELFVTERGTTFQTTPSLERVPF